MIFNRARLPAPIAAAVALAFSPAVMAQNTSGVSNPNVEPGVAEIGYRLAYSVEDGAAPGSFAHRFQYEQSINDSIRFRAAAVLQDRNGEALDLRSLQFRGVWQLVDSKKSGWDGAVIAILTAPTTEGSPEKLQFGWAGAVNWNERWQSRAHVYGGVEFGDAARDGLLVATRAETTYKLDNGMRIGAQVFNDFNTTAHFGRFDEQKHQLGFVVKDNISKRLSYEGGALFGVSARASDADLRLFLTYRL
ncbi:MAG: hypothetical protein VX640_12510 [Pseudomonadota bacterium]|nr:hypothetical protein [Pseudomonadota bacterium]